MSRGSRKLSETVDLWLFVLSAAVDSQRRIGDFGASFGPCVRAQVVASDADRTPPGEGNKKAKETAVKRFLWLSCFSVQPSSASSGSCRAGTADQVVFVDVDNFHRLIDMCEGHWPVGSDCLVVVDRALVVAVMQAAGANQRVDFAVVETIDERFHNDANVVHLRFLEEGNATRRIIWQGSHDLIFARRVDAEDVAFDGIQYGNAVVAFIFPEFVFHQLALVSRHRHCGQHLPESDIGPEYADKPTRQRTSAGGQEHQADRRQHDPAS